jgi:hypothetical protein
MMIALHPGPNTRGYNTDLHWERFSVNYRIVDNLDESVRLARADLVREINQAAGNWNIQSKFKLNNSANAPSYPLQGGVMAAGLYASTVIADIDQFRRAYRSTIMTFNTSANHRRNVNGDMTTFQAPELGMVFNSDVEKVTAHEFGHWLGLGHPASMFPTPPSANSGDCNNSILACAWFNTTIPTIDDKLGAVMMYGIDTGFESSQFLGLTPNPNVEPPGYVGSGSYATCQGLPAYWTYTYASQGMSTKKPPLPAPNDREMRFDGCAKSGTSPNYAYATISSSRYDGVDTHGGTNLPQPCGTTCYLRIQRGMNLRWYQYNAQQCTVSLDIEFVEQLPSANGSHFLRDYRPGGQAYRDTAGVSVHPAERDCGKYGTLNWFYVQINLDPFEGLHVKRILAVYDNSRTNLKQQWRVYFDPIILGF